MTDQHEIDFFPPIEKIPLHGQLYRRRIRNGDSLSHINKLSELSPFEGECPYLVCMGRTKSGSLHCWLETDEVVVDLTVHQRFFVREFYYETTPGIMVDSVRRYTHREIETRLELNSFMKFWGFEETT